MPLSESIRAMPKGAEDVLGLARTIMWVEDELGSLYRTAFYAEVGLIMTVRG